MAQPIVLSYSLPFFMLHPRGIDHNNHALLLYLSQFKSQRVKIRKKSYIKVNTRELNRVSSTRMFTLYTLDY